MLTLSYKVEHTVVTEKNSYGEENLLVDESCKIVIVFNSNIKYLASFAMV